jgi:plasmid stabilization system protein ParE
MSSKERPATQSRDLVLIGDYLRAALRPASSRPEAALEGPDRRGGVDRRSKGAPPVNSGLLLLQAVVAHCTYPQLPELKPFIDELEQLRQGWEQSAGSPGLEEVDEAGEVLRRQREAWDEQDARHAEEIHEIVVMFHRAVAALTQGSRRNLSRLGTLERDLDQASKIGDLAALRGRLGNVLEFIRAEREEEKAQAASVVEKLQKEFQAIDVVAPESGGLSGKDLAVATLRRSWGDGMMAAVVHLEQVHNVTERHGQETAQRLVNEILAQVASRVDLPYTVYTWDLDSILLVFEGVSDSEQVRRLIRQQLVTIPGTFILDVASRKTLFRFPHRWLVLSQADEPTAERAVTQLEAFLRSQQA